MREHVAERLAGRSALCAVSGGVDSVVLLHLMRALGARVVAAHVEHGIRGESSQRDCAFVRDLCARWGVELVTAHLDVPGQARQSGRGLEETARAMRYDFLWAQRERLGLDCVVTAHHLNDQAETLLMHLIRGASPLGLAGMAEEQGALLRPLLPFTRGQIEDYAAREGLNWVEDESNGDVSLTRNYIRREILPRMEHLNPRAVPALGRLAELAAAQNDFVLQQAEEALRLRSGGGALADVRDLHPGLRGAVLHQYLIREGAPAFQSDVARLERLLDAGVGRRASVGKALFERDAAGVRRVRAFAPVEGYPLRLGENRTPLGEFTLRLGPAPARLDLGPNAQALDAERAGTSLCVRTRRPGDRVRLLGGGTRKLSDVLIDRKVPRALRDRVPLVERDGEIVWVAGVAALAPCALHSGSARALTIDYKAVKE